MSAPRGRTRHTANSGVTSRIVTIRAGACFDSSITRSRRDRGLSGRRASTRSGPVHRCGSHRRIGRQRVKPIALRTRREVQAADQPYGPVGENFVFAAAISVAAGSKTGYHDNSIISWLRRNGVVRIAGRSLLTHSESSLA